jgi:SNF2 family DNA or RNA helicase
MTTLIKPYKTFAYLPHQAEGVRWMLQRESGGEFCRGGILADDMGLGKTWQAVGLFRNALVRRTLLVTPPVLTKQWTTALTQSKIPFAELNRLRWLGSPNAVVYLATYDRLVNQVDFVAADEPWDRIVLDEGQYIRNGPKTRRFRALNALVAPRKWVLTGTPVQNSQRDFYHLASWLGCNMDEPLKRLASSVILRRSITLLAAEMPAPPKHERANLPFASEKEGEFFQILVGRLEHALENRFPSSCILELYLRIQMFISHPQIYVEAMRRKYGQTYIRSDWSEGSTKLAAFNALTAVHAPTLVFCHFKMEMDYIAASAARSGYQTFFVRGGFSEAARNAQIDESKAAVTEGKPTMLICQITAANCGLNLQHLTRVVFYTQHWNPAVIDQALTRSYRYGQTSEVQVNHLILGSAEMLNIDRLMLSKHQAKRSKAKELLPSLEFAYHPDFAEELGFLPEPMVLPAAAEEEAGDPE